jgi:protein-S-isoprenylcysteine O-methyltransferase Ste14
MARAVSNAPKQVTWIIALVLYVVALLGTFGVVAQITGQITQWSWIIGFGLMLLATKMKGL